MQSAGPTTFTADPAVTGVDVSRSTIEVGPDRDGWFDARLAVTVRVTGSQAAPVSLVLGPFGNGIRTVPGGDWNRCQVTSWFVTCELGSMTPGATTDIGLSFRMFSPGIADNALGRVYPRTDGLEYPTVPIRVTNP